MEQSDDLVGFLLEEMGKQQLAPADITKRSGLSPAQVSRILNRESPPGKKALSSFAKALRLPAALLYEMAGDIETNDLDPKSQEVLHLYRMMNETNRDDLVQYARLRVKIQEGNEKSKRPPSRPYAPK